MSKFLFKHQCSKFCVAFKLKSLLEPVTNGSKAINVDEEPEEDDQHASKAVHDIEEILAGDAQ